MKPIPGMTTTPAVNLASRYGQSTKNSYFFMDFLSTRKELPVFIANTKDEKIMVNGLKCALHPSAW